MRGARASKSNVRFSNESEKFPSTSTREVLCRADGATLDDVREAVETLEDTARTARRVLGGAHPMVGKVERNLLEVRELRAALAAHETPPTDAREDGDLEEVEDA